MTVRYRRAPNTPAGGASTAADLQAAASAAELLKLDDSMPGCLLAGLAGCEAGWLAGWLLAAGWAGWLAGWMADIRFHRFSWISCISADFMRFHGFQGSGVKPPVAPCGGLWRRGPSPIETFARCQFAAIAAISSIFMIFMDFMRFHEISRISGVGAWRPVAPNAIEVLPL